MVLARTVSHGLLETGPGQSPRVVGKISRQQFHLLFPKAIAAHANELFIVDSGHGTILRFDQMRNVFNAFAPMPSSTAEVDLFVDKDLSLYVVDARSGEVRQYNWHGDLVQHYRDDQNMRQPVAVVVAPGGADILVADGLRAIVLGFNRLGGVSGSLGARLTGGPLFQDIVAMARGPDTTFISDKLARLIYVFGPNQRLQTVFGEDSLEQPQAIAVDDYQRAFVVDRFDSTIKVYHRTALQAVVDGDDIAGLSFQQILDLWYSDQFLYVADGANARVSILSILPPCE